MTHPLSGVLLASILFLSPMFAEAAPRVATPRATTTQIRAATVLTIPAKPAPPMIASTRPLMTASPKTPREASGSATRSVELYSVNLYQAVWENNGCYSATGDAHIRVRNTGKPIILALVAYEPVMWKLMLDPGVDLRRVILGGYGVQTVQGVPSRVPVDQYTYFRKERVVKGAEALGGFFYDARTNNGIYYAWADRKEVCPKSAAVPAGERMVLQEGTADYLPTPYLESDYRYPLLIAKLKALTGLDVVESQLFYSYAPEHSASKPIVVPSK